jgi:hypothetical protein
MHNLGQACERYRVQTFPTAPTLATPFLKPLGYSSLAKAAYGTHMRM